MGAAVIAASLTIVWPSEAVTWQPPGLEGSTLWHHPTSTPSMKKKLPSREKIYLQSDFPVPISTHANAAQREIVMDWQPLETAPKDGTPILIWRGASLSHNKMITPIVVARWQRHYFQPVGTSTSAYGATHWMPLPEPPQ